MIRSLRHPLPEAPGYALTANSGSDYWIVPTPPELSVAAMARTRRSIVRAAARGHRRVVVDLEQTKEIASFAHLSRVLSQGARSADAVLYLRALDDYGGIAVYSVAA